MSPLTFYENHAGKELVQYNAKLKHISLNQSINFVMKLMKIIEFKKKKSISNINPLI